MTRRSIQIQMGITLALAAAAPASAQGTAEYAFEFVAEWSAQTHPDDFPSNAHFSPVVGATHTDAAELWSPGGIASPGIEQMAETGASSVLRNQVLGLISDGDAFQFLNLGGLGDSPGVRTGSIIADADFPFLTLVSMIAPSPDWFVGIHSVNLRENGVWAAELVFDLDPYDSGTDAGVTYTSPNADITPHIPIENLAGVFPFAGGGRIGTFRITLLSDAACNVADLAEPYDTLDLSDVNAFIAAFIGMQDAADLNGDGVYDLDDLSAFVGAFIAGCP